MCCMSAQGPFGDELKYLHFVFANKVCYLWDPRFKKAEVMHNVNALSKQMRS